MASGPCESVDLTPHSSIVLFYKYFCPLSYPLISDHQDYYEEKLLIFQQELCTRLHLKGRVLLAAEGINGTLSASRLENLKQYIIEMENFELIRDVGVPETKGTQCKDKLADHFIFEGVDWKESTIGANEQGIIEPFPDLKVSIVPEIISSGGSVSVGDLRHGGKHLSPAEFHQTLLNDPNVVLIDVRNTFEYDIGHFFNPNTEREAINPEMVTFSSFDSSFGARRADQLKDKKVFLYCTGGIRCEKASVMLKRRGVEDVSQLSGGIHRYLEEYGDKGFFRGLNFVFDQRVAMNPREHGPERNADCTDNQKDIVGRCVECNDLFDEVCGSRLCTVCRDLVLVCLVCQGGLREYHCRRHSEWKRCYFTFLEVFDRESLEAQRGDLLNLRGRYIPPPQNRNVRRTISRQIEKISNRIVELDSGNGTVDHEAPRRCRTCMDPSTVCDGRCWGFWKTQATRCRAADNHAPTGDLEAIEIGEEVEPGPHWNGLRLGSKMDASGMLKRGIVVEVKSWGSGGPENDCVSVRWTNENEAKRSQPQIYRWGTVALNGVRMYDLCKVYGIEYGSQSFSLNDA
jgi:predicted sulfurtransferase